MASAKTNRSSISSSRSTIFNKHSENNSVFGDVDNEWPVHQDLEQQENTLLFDEDSVSVRSYRSRTSQQKLYDDNVSVTSSKYSVRKQNGTGYRFKSGLNTPVREKETNPIILPSYKTKNNIKSVLIQSTKVEVLDVNKRYNRNRRYDAAGKYRIGPSFITKSRLAYVDEHKPAKLSVIPDPLSKSLEFGLLTYLWTFTDQHDKQEIDLSFLQSLIDSGVNINCRDEHGQTILHAIVRDWHTDVALFAIRNNANVNAEDKLGRSPLHLAAALNCAETARVLLLNGAKVDILTKNENQTPMHYAAKFNSIDTMKMLIRFHASITQRDSRDRTVLFLAAESGSTDTAQFLLDIGAPVGVYDTSGYSLISHLLEKMPHIAYRALHQLVLTNSSLKQSGMYLNYLESNSKGGKTAAMISKSPIEIITIYDDVDLIMHPVIQKAIEVKWKLFGRNDTIRKLSITSLYLICWLLLAYTFGDKKEREYYKPYSDNAWKIIPETLIIIFALYFFYHDFTIKKDAIKYHRAWVEWRQHIVRANYVNCHPAWPSDRETLEAEAERVRCVPGLALKQKFWFVYEWIVLLIVAAIVITRVVDMHVDKREVFILHKCIFGFGLILSFVRVLKVCIRFRYFSVFLKIAGLAVGSFIQITFLYIQLFVPFVASFWLIFGNSKVNSSHHDNSTTAATDEGIEDDLDDIFFNVFQSLMGQDSTIAYVTRDKITAQILISLFHVLVTFILLAVFVALITSKFTTHYKSCVAQASLLQASVVLQLEKNLNKRNKAKLAAYYNKFCNPLVVHAEKFAEHHEKSTALSRLRLAERRLTGIENVVHEVEDKYTKNDRRSQNTLLENIVNTTTEIEHKQDEFVKSLAQSLKEINQKQEYMNKYLPKLLQPT